MQEWQINIVCDKKGKMRGTLLRVEKELRKGYQTRGLGRGAVSSVTAACMLYWVTVCPSVRTDISVCLVLPYRLPETVLVSSLGACCHWLKRREGVERVCAGVCVCEREWQREKLEQLSWKLFHSVSTSRICFPLIYPQLYCFSQLFGQRTSAFKGLHLGNQCVAEVTS